MAQDAIDHALKTGKLGVQARPCATTHLKLVCSWQCSIAMTLAACFDVVTPHSIRTKSMFLPVAT